ncbi:MAG: type II toxin-antitoxin system HicB family antitoxin [Candidatus Viridilinea halotolerans]|uniref:Type II toxin-antitoxin system HicB family antitoxin n=1 Tax=Candidatus Viridilinea halotolerans TaxID=2491704 RepID=A0A426TZX3_9CHLR|nr:MAG: type II toxin-antitoxin system HicB family antitoxin [Candidatus Viridilinea halotolerans]
MNLTAVYVQDGEWIAAMIEEFPGIHSQGKTLEEARENLRDALQLMIKTHQEELQHELAEKSIVQREVFEPAPHTARGTSAALLASIEPWVGDDQRACLELVYATRTPIEVK